VFKSVGISLERFDRYCLAFPDAREAGARKLIAGIHRVAGHARLEYLCAAFRIAGRGGDVSNREGQAPDQGGEGPSVTYFVIHKASAGPDRYFTDVIK